MREDDWLSAHIFHRGDLDRLLVDVTSALGRARLVRGLFFLRYWEGGDHVRLRMLPADGVAAADLGAFVADHCHGYFRRHPSASRPDPHRYAEQARVLAGWEGLTGYARELYPNDSVAFIPYRREYDRYGRGAAMLAVERHFMESSRIALSLLAAGLEPARRDTVAWSMLMLSRLLHGEPPPEPADGDWLARTGISPAGFARLYEGQRDRLDRLAARLRRFAMDLPATPGVLADWGRTVVRLRDELCAANPQWPPARTSAVLDTCGHLLCNRLGLSLPHEGYLRYLLARTTGRPSLLAGGS